MEGKEWKECDAFEYEAAQMAEKKEEERKSRQRNRKNEDSVYNPAVSVRGD